jgi:hypothetical protein
MKFDDDLKNVLVSMPYESTHERAEVLFDA